MFLIRKLTSLGGTPELFPYRFPPGGVCDQVRHVRITAGSVPTHAGQGSPAHRWLRKGQEGRKMVVFF